MGNFGSTREHSRHDPTFPSRRTQRDAPVRCSLSLSADVVNAARLRGLLESVYRARQALNRLLTDEERTKPKCTGSSTYDWSIEDAARAVITHKKHPRRRSMIRALGMYRAAINAAWSESIAQNVHGDLLALWIRSGGQRGGRARIPTAELEAEIVYMLRTIIAEFNAEKIDADTTLKQYAYTPIMRGLGVFSERFLAPVAIPRDAARKFGAGELSDSDTTEVGRVNDSYDSGDRSGSRPMHRMDRIGAADPLIGLYEETHGRTEDEIRKEREQ